MYPSTRVRRAVEQLRTVRAQWGALLVAIETPPAPTWPPAQLSTHLARQAADDVELLVADRVPLTLREHPAPANLSALDAAVRVERLLFEAADILAAAVQRPVERRPISHPGRPVVWAVDQADAADPRRWLYASATDPGSRRHGLHWAAMFIEGRLLDEDTEAEQRAGALTRGPALFALLPEHLVHEAVRVAGQAERLVLGALELDRRESVIEGRPCPWCSGELTLHTDPQTAPSVTCSTGPACTAPAAPDRRGRRTWVGAELVELLVALDRPAAGRAA
ncbi:hypothetical protein [Streptomyces sp. MJM8645]|uniref:hypothetical protein n=1 Tax=Streptomycetaceae TaxID=2062 RepID=UPI0007AF7BE0|nr:hypothetical protein [Streptomyces sp. MJM8645]